MTDKPSQVAIRKWSCPNHEYPVTTSSIWGEEGHPPWEEFPAVAEALAELPAEHPARIEFGLCCRNSEWVTVGWRDARPFEEFMFDFAHNAATRANWLPGPFLVELSGGNDR